MSDQYEVMRALQRRHVRYLVVGEAALAHHARVRRVSACRRVDYFVEPESGNQQRLAGALGDLYGEGVFEAVPGKPLSWPSTVNIIPKMDGVISIHEVYPDRVEVREGDLVIPVLGRHFVAKQFAKEPRAMALLSQGDQIRSMERLLKPSELAVRFYQKRTATERERKIG